MTTKTTPWDAAVYLETEKDVVEYLAAAFETGELEDVTHALATIARARGMTEMAKSAGLARGSLYKAIGEGANPTLATLFSVLNALNVSLSVKPKAAA
ncbi:MAG: addiction module antidote protein [Caulobacteraceae bacterium]